MDKNLPVLLLKKLSLLPLQEVRIELNNELSKKIVDLSISSFDNKVIVILPINSLEESPTVSDLPSIGVLASIKSSIILPNKNYRVVLKGLNRIKINGYSNYKIDKSILISNIKRIYIDKGETVEQIALKKKLLSLLHEYISSSPEISNSILSKVSNDNSLDELTDIIVNFLHFPMDKKIIYMNEFDESVRAKNLIKDLNVELEIIRLNNKIDNDIRFDFEKEQKEYLIKQRIEKLNSELGLSSSKDSEITLYHTKIEELDVDDKTRNKLVNELKKYEYTPSNNPEISVIRNYLDTILSLPFNKSNKEETKEDKISKSLNKTHYGMDKVKRRIIEYALLKAKNPDLENPIICLVGPPGTGKSTIARSISNALKRDFYKISVGGLNDSSELLGHRRTYLGAAPGKIMEAVLKCNSNNPVILIDEVDKMVKDYKGDPASTLLDILDPIQNKTFVDNYIEEPFDLSKVLFILTANDYNLIPPALKDRLEIINVSSYTLYDKKDIALSYLIPDICDKYGIKKLKFDEELIINIIKNYTLESGVRELERILDELIRYIIINNVKESAIGVDSLLQILGNPLMSDVLLDNHYGEANIVGVSPLGGLLIKVQTVLTNTYSDYIITGKASDELKDSISIAISYLKANSYIDSKKLTTSGIHINFTNNKYSLDGSSGTLGIAAAILSLFTNKLIPGNVLFMGSLDLYGNITKVSSIKEKVITAYNNKITTIYSSVSNKEDESSIPEFILKELNIIYVSNFEEIYKLIFKHK
jgi:ATP-dependent Lon protease